MRAGRDGSVHALKLRLLAAVSGVSVSMACGGRSDHHAPPSGTGEHAFAGAAGSARGGRSGSGGSSGTGAVGGTSASSGSGGSAALGGTSASSGSGGSGAVEASGSGGSGGTTLAGGAGGVGGSAMLAGAGGVSGAAGQPHATLGCTAAGDYSPGLEACNGGFVHRQSPMACPRPLHDGSSSMAGAGGEAGATLVQYSPCENDADCAGLADAYCLDPASPPHVNQSGYCISACTTDADCAPGSVCSCDPGYFESFATKQRLAIGVCKAATCVTDADCDAGLLCIAPTSDICGTVTPAGFHCQSAADECSGPQDCIPTPGLAYSCQSVNGRYTCESGRCGRPFLVDGRQRQSDTSSSSAWRDPALAPMEGMPTLAARGVIAEHFTQAALMEHASIAAFARFSLQLLALGAPPDLVAAAARAMADETRHAQRCFELASRYAGRNVGPGPLDIDGALEAFELRDVVELALIEGCVGETAAALEARWAAEAATDPLVQSVLAEIAADEEQHATLAFRFVAWASERDARLVEQVRARVRALALEHSLAPDPSEADSFSAELAAHGVLSAERRRSARRAALLEIAPAVLARLSAGRQPCEPDSLLARSVEA